MRNEIFAASALLAALSITTMHANAGPIYAGASMAGPAIIAAEPDADAEAAAAPVRVAAQPQGQLGGGFIEFLFSGQGARSMPRPRYEPYPAAPQPGAPPEAAEEDMQPGLLFQPQRARSVPAEPAERAFDPRYERQEVAYQGPHAPGTIVIDTPNRFLYLVQDGGRAVRYGVGVGRPGFSWAGVKHVSAKREWPDWIPPKEMLQRRPDLPRHMEGGPNNPLGARALYLGSSLYRIHGSNEPWTIGQAVSSGCIRMRNQDVIDLYDRVRVGTRVIVI